MIPLILASSSTYRAALLQRLQLPFTQVSPNIDESAHPNETGQDLCARLAKQKAHAVLDQLQTPALVIASDQVACLDQTIFGKPGNFDTAKQQLLNSSEQMVTFYTSLYLANSETEQHFNCVVPFYVQFRKLSSAQIKSYLHKEQPFDCAGSFKAEGLGIALFKRMHGDDPNALIGLPLIALCQGLQQLGVDVLNV